MFSVSDFLDRAKAGAGGVTDYRLARLIGVTTQTISHYRSGARAPDERAIQALCALSGDDAEHVAACIQSMRHLGVTARTLAQWQRDDSAPRVARLALFWETRWGLSVAHCDAVNGERVALGLARALERECAMLRARIRRLEETGDFGAANSPVWASR